jgi:hypothetical protein
MRPIHRRYQREFLPAMLAYAAVMLLIWPLAEHRHGGAAKIVLALVPMLPLGLAVRAMVRLVLGADELEQRLHLVALAVSSVVVGMVSMTLGFLAAAGALALPGAALVWVFPAQCLSYGLARKWAGRRYGEHWSADEDGCGALTPRRLLVAALAIDAAAWLARSRLDDWQFGFLLGLGGSLAAWGLVWLLARRRAAHQGRTGA